LTTGIEVRNQAVFFFRAGLTVALVAAKGHTTKSNKDGALSWAARVRLAEMEKVLARQIEHRDQLVGELAKLGDKITAGGSL
jgi:hypothetical protein